MLPSYFDRIFVLLWQKVRLRPEIFVNFWPEPDLKSPARFTTLKAEAQSIESKPEEHLRFYF